jgi:hypothetical protein
MLGRSGSGPAIGQLHGDHVVQDRGFDGDIEDAVRQIDRGDLFTACIEHIKDRHGIPHFKPLALTGISSVPAGVSPPAANDL